MSTKLKLLTLAVVTSVLVPGAVFAVNGNANGRTVVETSGNSPSSAGNSEGNYGVAIKSDGENANAIRNCEKIHTKLQTKSTTYNKAKDAHSVAYDNMLSRLNRFSENIKAKGYDTEVLDSDIDTLAEKVAEYKQSIQSSYQAMQQTMSGFCASSATESKSSLRQARSQIRQSHQLAIEIRAYYKNVIKPDLLDLKEQYPGAVSNAAAEQEPAEQESTLESE